MADHKQPLWHEMDGGQVLEHLETDGLFGLSEEEARARQEREGKNALTGKKKESEWKKFFRQFHNIFIYIMLVAAVVTSVLGLAIDTVVILIVAFVNALMGYIQENKAERALESIKKMLSLHAAVIRDGKRTVIDAVDLVPGDIVLLQAGDKIPADIRLMETINFKVEESALTGESVPVEKGTGPLRADTVLGDRINMAYSGTTVAAGTAKGIVVEIGNNTELGKINLSLQELEKTKTPFIEQITIFGKQIAFAILAFGFFLFIVAYLMGNYPIDKLALSIIALIVATIPEGLPAIMSILLAVGVQNMAKRHAIVRNLPSVETLGSVSVICSDKTGTLTKNEMTVRNIVTAEGNYTVTGTGYSPCGKILNGDNEVDILKEQELYYFLLSVTTANDAALVKDENGDWAIDGDPTDGSLIALSKKANHSLPQLEKIDKIPFDSAYKYMAVLAKHAGEKYIFLKGAPDRLFDLAVYEGLAEKPFNRPYWEGQIEKLAAEGKRVLGAAYIKVRDEDQLAIDHEDLHGDVVFLGLAGIIDPPRGEALEAIKACNKAGIQVKMITGDHPETAAAIGRQLGIGKLGAIEGKMIDQMSEEELLEAVEKYDIFARTSPENKLQLIDALQKNGEIVSMTGDGVNDAPSLKKADIGVAMGIKGTETAKDAAEMILADDNFGTIFNAVKEGRRIYDNFRKTVLFILPTNVCEAILIAGSILLGFSVILTPVQILWINLITSVTISFGLIFEKLEEDALTRPPRPRNAPLLSKYHIFRIAYVSLMIGVVCILLVYDLMEKGFSPALIQTTVMNAIVFAEMFHLFNCRSETGPAISKDFFANKIAFLVSGLLVILQLAITYLPLSNIVFGTVPMEAADWVMPIAIGLLVFVVVELEKGITRTIVNKKEGMDEK